MELVSRPLSDIIKSIVRKMTDYARSRDWGIYGIGIGVPSVVDKGVVLFANNLPELDNQQLDLALAEFNLPVFIDNDANLMGLGEVIYGAAKGLPAAAVADLADEDEIGRAHV